MFLMNNTLWSMQPENPKTLERRINEIVLSLCSKMNHDTVTAKDFTQAHNNLMCLTQESSEDGRIAEKLAELEIFENFFKKSQLIKQIKGRRYKEKLIAH